MTREELKAFAALSAETYKREQLVQSLRNYYEKAGAGVGTDNAVVNDILDDISELESQIEELKARHSRMTPEFEKLISGVDAGRTSIRLHYLHGFSWSETGAAIGRTEHAAKKSAYRIIEKLFEGDAS